MAKLSTKNLAKYSAMISLILILSKVVGFIREMLVATQFGASRESDIFKTATRIPNLFYSVVAAALLTSFIPIFSSFKNDEKKANLFFNNIFNVLFLLCAILSIIGMVFTPQITKLFVSGFNNADFIRTYNMTRISMPSIIFLALSGLQQGYLNSYGIFLQPALTSIISSIIMIIGMMFVGRYGIVAAVIGFFLGAVAQVMFQLPFMKNYKFKFYINIHDENVKKMLLLSVPIIISSAVSQVNVIVDSTFASNLARGSMSIIDYASKVSTIINQVFIVSITTIFYPMLTEKYALGSKEDFKDLIIKSLNIVVIIAIPLIIGMIILSTPLVRLLLQHGKFNSSDTEITALCLRVLALGTLGYSLIDILGKVFFSVKDTVTPMINGIITVGLNILFIVILVPRMGISGLSTATTSSASIIAIVMIFELKYKLKDISFNSFIKVLLKALMAGGIMGVIVSLTYTYLGGLINNGSSLVLAIKITLEAIIGIAVYIAMLYFLKVKELDSIIALRKRK